MDRSKQLEEGKISQLLLKFSIPAITGMLVNALYNVVDTIFVGQGVGPLGIAGLTIGFPIMIVLMAFAMLIGVGATSLISIRLGEKRKKDAELIMGNAVVLLIVLPAIISALGLLFINPLLQLFGASENVMPYAKDYLNIILFGAVFQSLGMGMNNFIRADGSPKTAMFTMLIGAILNTILDPIFIFLFGWGVKGAAIATILSQAVSAVWVLYYFLGGASQLKIHKENLRLNAAVVRRILAIGSAPFAMQIASSILTTILNKSLVIYGGDLAVSGMGIINRLTMLILMPIFGINQGAQPIIGYNYGAHKYDRVKKTLKLAIAAATTVILVGFVVVMTIPKLLIGLFTRDAGLIQFSSQVIRIYLFFLPVVGFQIVSANYFQAVGKPRQAMFLSLSRQVVLLIPALFILPLFWGLNGVFMAGPFSDLCSAILTGIWLFMELRHLDKRHEASMIKE